MFLFVITSLALAAQPTKRAKDFDRGGNLYKQNCWMCHGKMGEGDGPAAAALSTEAPALAKRLESSEQTKMVRVILDGRGDMPSFSPIFGRADAKRILKWLEDPKPVQKPKAKAKKEEKDKRKSKKPKTAE